MGFSACTVCHERLSDEFAAITPRLPCPKCGSLLRDIYQSVSHDLSISDSTVPILRFAHTDREVKGAQALVDAQEWSTISTFDELIDNAFAKTFAELISTATRLDSASLILYRGTGISRTESSPPTLGRMGPKPRSLPWKEGRYHREGERALYLSDSEDGVRREMKAWRTEGEPWAIRSEIPLDGLRIADFSIMPSDHFLTAAFSVAEKCKIEGRGPDNYFFSQALASLVSKRFDGMLVPGVRGEPGSHYRNAVIFTHLDEWLDWSHSEPYLLPPLG